MMGNAGQPADRLGPVTLDPTNAEEVARKAAWFWLAWDQEHLYMAADVNSPYGADNTARQGRNAWWCYDSVQLRTFFPDAEAPITHWGFFRDTPSGADFIPTAQGEYQHEVGGENPPGRGS